MFYSQHTIHSILTLSSIHSTRTLSSIHSTFTLFSILSTLTLSSTHSTFTLYFIPSTQAPSSIHNTLTLSSINSPLTISHSFLLKGKWNWTNFLLVSNLPVRWNWCSSNQFDRPFDHYRSRSCKSRFLQRWAGFRLSHVECKQDSDCSDAMRSWNWSEPKNKISIEFI